MKWMLVVVVLNTPVKTDLTFDSLRACLGREESMRIAWQEEVTRATAWLKQFPDAYKGKEHVEFVHKQTPWGTCIPAKV